MSECGNVKLPTQHELVDEGYNVGHVGLASM